MGALSDLEQALALGVLIHDLDDLLDVHRCFELVASDVHADGVLHELTRQLPHVLRPGGAPEQRLPVWPDLTHNLRSKTTCMDHQCGPRWVVQRERNSW